MAFSSFAALTLLGSHDNLGASKYPMGFSPFFNYRSRRRIETIFESFIWLSSSLLRRYQEQRLAPLPWSSISFSHLISFATASVFSFFEEDARTSKFSLTECSIFPPPLLLTTPEVVWPPRSTFRVCSRPRTPFGKHHKISASPGTISFIAWPP